MSYALLIWAIALLLVRDINCENSVLVKSEYQLVTSSTLKWISPINGKIPENSVVGSVQYKSSDYQNDLQIGKPKRIEKKIYVCHASHNGAWIPGALHEDTKRCIISFVGKVFEYERYEVLQNMENAARLIWKDWSKDQQVPVGAVISGGDTFIAHRVSPNFTIEKTADGNENPVGTTYLIGKLDPNQGIFGKISVINEDNEEESNLGDGQVLIEIEPVLYELTIVKLNDARKKVDKRLEMLGEVTLQNRDEPGLMTVDSVIGYEWNYTSNWGQGKAMLKGLPTTINFQNSTQIETIKWGIMKIETINDIERVEASLDLGVAVHIKVFANISHIEIPYTAKLLSVFNDSTIMSRTVHGTWQKIAILDIQQQFGPLYFIQNLTKVSTTTATTTTTTITTTTTTTTEPPTTQTPTTVFVEKLKPIEYIPKKPEDEMISDDGDALQLKKKEVTNSLASSNMANIFSVLSFLLLFIYMRNIT